MNPGQESKSQEIVGNRFASLANDEPIKLSKFFVAALEQLGVRSAFGVTGGAIGSIFEELSQSRISIYHCQHEGGAAFLAMGRSLVCPGGEVPVCFSTAGPGITNLLTGVAAAYEERVPLLVVTGNSSKRNIDRFALQDAFWSGIDAQRLLSGMTVSSKTVMNPNDLIPSLREAFMLARRFSRPVHLNVPLDLAQTVPELKSTILGQIAQLSLDRELQRTPRVEDLYDGVLEDFVNAKRPLIFAGNGLKTSGLRQDFTETVDLLGLPVIVTCHGKGLIAEDHPLYRGAFGFATNGEALEFMRSYDPDAVLYIGTRLGELSSGGWDPILSKPGLRLHVDFDSDALGKAININAPILADAKEILERLRFIGRHSAPEIPPKQEQSRYEVTPSSPVSPIYMMDILDFEMPEDSVLFAENGNSMAWVINRFLVRGEREYYVPLGLASMGAGICNSIGASSVVNDRVVACIAGDCAMMMNGNELFTAQENKIPIKMFVLNDGGHGMVDHGSKMMGLDSIDVRFKRKIDFSKYASAMGVKNYVARTNEEFSDLPFAEIWNSKEPVLVDVRIDTSIAPPLGSRARVLGQS